MPSTYTLNNGIELIGTGEQSGTWGDTTNTNFELIDTALDGQVTVTLASAGTSGAPNTLPISDGSSSNGRNRMVIFDDGGDLGATAYVQLTPSDAEKIVYVRNDLSGSRSIILFQGTYNASNDYEVPAGTTAVVYFDGAGAGAVAANVFNNAYFDSLRLGGVSVTAILDEDNMASDSATALATQQSIKAYVDAQVGANNELSEVLANGNTTGGNNIQMTTTDEVQFRDTALKISSSADGQLDIDADVEVEIVAPTLDIDASTAVTIDTATLTMTGSVNVVGDLDVDNLNLNGNSIISTNANGNIALTPNGTGEVDISKVDIDGGTIDGTTIGGASAAAGTFTTATATTGNITTVNATTVDSTNVEVTNIKAKDGTASATIADSTGVMTIASSVLTTTDINGGTIDGVTIGGSSAGAITGTTITGSSFVTTGDMTFGDNDKAIFGAGSDLQIYHDGSDSFILDNGAGNLAIRGSSSIFLQSPTGETYLKADNNGAVNLYYDNATKLATTSTGVDVTGTVTADGVDVSSAAGGVNYKANSRAFFGSLYSTHYAMLGSAAKSDETANSRMVATETSTGNGLPSAIQLGAGNIDFHTLASSTAGAAFDNKRMRIDKSGDISFYEDTGTTPKFFWDASAEQLALSNAVAGSALVITKGNTTGNALEISNSGESRSLDINHNADGTGTVDDIVRIKSNGTSQFVIKADGSVGIGTSSPNELIELSSASDPRIRINNSASSLSANTIIGGLEFYTNDGSSGGTGIGASIDAYAQGNFGSNQQGLYLTFSTRDSGSGETNTERMRIDSSGLVGIGTNDPAALGGGAKLTVNQAADGNIVFARGGSTRQVQLGTTSTTGYINADNASGGLAFHMNGTEAMRIDSSGNLLVGKSSQDQAVEGFEYSGSSKYMYLTKGGGVTAYFDRLTSDGDIVEFRKAGTTVGSIGSNSGVLTVGNANTGGVIFGYNAGHTFIEPSNTSGASTDDLATLGSGTKRFRDLYLSGGVYLGGIVAANKLDDYEEGTFTVTLDFATSSTGSLNYTNNTFRYIKIGDMVFISGFLTWDQNNFTASSGDLRLEGLPFATASSNAYRGGVSITYSSTPWTGLTVYQQSMRAEISDTKMTFNYSDTTDGSMDSVITSHTSIDSTGQIMITGSYPIA